MKFLLTAVNAKYIHSNPAIYSLRAYAGAELQEYIELAEYTINNQMQDILADIYRRKPNVVAFSCYIWNWNMIQELLTEVPKLLPETDIWLGGPEVSFDAPEILQKYPQLTGIMVGEGEDTFRELLNCYVNQYTPVMCKEKYPVECETLIWSVKGNRQLQEKMQKIPGLCLPTGYTPIRELIDMNTLPFLYEDLEPFTNKIIYYESSRGCPYRCSYCLSSIDKKVRLRDIGVVKKELQFFLDNKVKQVKFVDRTFNCNHEHAMAIWEYLYENDNGVTNFHFEISADILGEDEIALLNQLRPGLAQLEIGVQSTNLQTLEAIHRVMNVERLEGIVEAIHKGHNVHQHLDLIAGLPYEDYESFAESFNRVYAMKPEQLQLGFLKVLKGSDMHEKATEYDVQYLNRPPYEVLSTKWLSYDDILKLKGIEEMVELYYNSNQFTHTLPVLEKVFASPFVMYETMAKFYEEKGYFVNSPSRAYRYQVLLEFAEKYDGDRTRIYRELLTYDMYLRENLKSRPDFASELTENVKITIREFYRKEEPERHYLPDYVAYDWKQLSKMTHLEPFCYPVWDVNSMIAITQKNSNLSDKSYTAELQVQHEDAREQLSYVLFDYRNRNPLTYEAEVQIVNL